MGNQKNFTVNADGSVTIPQELEPHISTILDIFRIEKAKGGLFACRRMKKAALKYAQSKGLEDAAILVSKLMLDHYPVDFGHLRKQQWFVFWCIMSIISAFFFFVVAQCVYSESRSGIEYEMVALACVLLTLVVVSIRRCIRIARILKSN